MTESKFMVSICCWTYNHTPYIKDAMNGFCMQQTTFPFVAIIIDDASTDDEPEVIREYLNKHFDIKNARKWETDDANIIEARNRDNLNCTFAVVLLKYNFHQSKKDKDSLIKQWTDTKYIAICEGDDYWTDPHKLQKQSDFLDKNPEYVVCTHDYQRYHQQGKKFEVKSYYEDLFRNFNLETRHIDYSLDNYFDRWWTQPLTAVYRNDSFLSLIPRDKYKYFRDSILFYYILKAGKGALLSDVMGVYRIHEGGIYSGKDAMYNEETAIYNASCILKIEGDRKAIKQMEHSELHRIYKLEKNGSLSAIIQDLLKYYKIAPFRSFFKMFCIAMRNQIGMLHAKIIKRK